MRTSPPERRRSGGNISIGRVAFMAKPPVQRGEVVPVAIPPESQQWATVRGGEAP
jgi:hypothetical protein